MILNEYQKQFVYKSSSSLSHNFTFNTRLNVNVYKFTISKEFNLSNFESCGSLGRKAQVTKFFHFEIESDSITISRKNIHLPGFPGR